MNSENKESSPCLKQPSTKNLHHNTKCTPTSPFAETSALHNPNKANPQRIKPHTHKSQRRCLPRTPNTTRPTFTMDGRPRSTSRGFQRNLTSAEVRPRAPQYSVPVDASLVRTKSRARRHLESKVEVLEREAADSKILNRTLMGLLLILFYFCLPSSSTVKDGAKQIEQTYEDHKPDSTAFKEYFFPNHTDIESPRVPTIHSRWEKFMHPFEEFTAAHLNFILEEKDPFKMLNIENTGDAYKSEPNLNSHVEHLKDPFLPKKCIGEKAKYYSGICGMAIKRYDDAAAEVKKHWQKAKASAASKAAQTPATTTSVDSNPTA
ncbi:hypothetical protein BDV95DRAFT_48040 [Massariosphaeria phaeospora]|uniref:Uncharacterized protein n=1 Tax=Massariosphaeria phaeospora TaxID=100035 RepID=A0A7C8IFI6_9PLEO|nr:hypothetical protein BDV95DRAFT_48040 [Massariosphaeria phaeospora]